jgi:hypothetical protein
MATSQDPASSRPLLLVDVDGVLSLFGFPPESPPSGVLALVDGLPHLLSPETAERLNRLATDYEMAWCTGWEERAGEHLPRLLGLPPGWPHVPLHGVGRAGASVAGHWKLDAIDAFAGHTRPVAWIDDALDAACEDWAAARPGPTLLVRTDPAVGLTEADAVRLRRWARAPRRPYSLQ